MFFTSPEDAHWNAEQRAVEFGVEIGEYRGGLVRVPRRVFQRILPGRSTPARCVEAYYLQRTRFESIAERKLQRRAGLALADRWETVPTARGASQIDPTQPFGLASGNDRIGHTSCHRVSIRIRNATGRGPRLD